MELNRLASSDASVKKLIIYSDLTENSDWFSFFKKTNQNKLLKRPHIIEKAFLKEYKLNDNLSGIQIYLVYQPTLETETIYRKLSALYKSILEKRGAIVHIQANL